MLLCVLSFLTPGCLLRFDPDGCAEASPYTVRWRDPSLYEDLPRAFGSPSLVFTMHPPMEGLEVPPEGLQDPGPLPLEDFNLDYVSFNFTPRGPNEHLTYYDGHYVAALFAAKRSSTEVREMFRSFAEQVIVAEESELDALTDAFALNRSVNGADAGYRLEVWLPSRAWELWEEQLQLAPAQREPLASESVGGTKFHVGDWSFNFNLGYKEILGLESEGPNQLRVSVAGLAELGFFETPPDSVQTLSGAQNLTRELGTGEILIEESLVVPSKICTQRGASPNKMLLASLP